MPGAVPLALCSFRPRTGTYACFSLLGGMVRPQAAKNARIRASSSSSKRSSSSKARATVCLVRSSSVGPSPPENTSKSLRCMARRTTLSSRAGLSPTTLWKCTVMPSCASCCERNCAFVFKISPSKSSVPTAIISAVMAIPPFRCGAAFWPRAARFASAAAYRHTASTGVSAAAARSSSARAGMAASAASISASVGFVLGCGGVKMVQQSS